ncbi:glycosyltransferase [Microbulbifer thermotolerans]|uniref:glycosyltransferase n=1 Tax=Microbulbifer thermotolerans TaxID=252514 RepID=UPI00224B39FE|nr:glycosyltransferase [Microbulbifer thermotolerans]MCX2780021.1 glycosyltransferase [Microbulbifer thermotolerans]MCX2805444.1 glycosyltransferase [Microbulbifer thermotolerans]
MRIVQLLPELDSGDLARTTLDFASELLRLGHEAIVISNGGELVPRLTLRGGRHIRMPLQGNPLWSLRLVRRLRRTLAELEVDVVHARGAVPAWIAWRAWRGMPADKRPRLVTGAHDFYRKSFYGAALAAGERVTAVSRCVADSLQLHFSGKLNQPPRVVHYGVNTREFDRDAPVSGQWQLRLLNQYPQLEGRHWLLMPARLEPGQGLIPFLRMLAAVVSQRDVFGLIVGDSCAGGEKYSRKLEQMAVELGLADRVLFLGPRRDMRELYASSQVCYSLAEQPEPYGRVAAEALAMNCPVVAYADCGSAEVLQRCFPQGLVERGNPDALVETTLRILDQPQMVRFSDFTHEDTAAQTLALYRELLQTA